MSIRIGFGFFVFFAVFCFFAANAAALSMDAGQKDFFLGDKIVFSGSCTGSSVEARVSIYNETLFLKSAKCLNFFYSVEFQTGLDYPTGKWEFDFSDSRDKNSVDTFIYPKQETVLLSLVLLTPAVEKLSRNDSVDFTVQVIFNNASFNDANVFYWVPDGSKSVLTPVGNGLFKGNFLVPVDFNESSWNLVMVAVNPVQKIRGQFVKAFGIEKAKMIISVIEPVVIGRIEAGVLQNILVEITYADGTPLKEPVVSIECCGNKGFLQQVSEKRFSYQKLFGGESIGPHTVVLAVTDAFGNSASREETFFVEKGFWLGFGNQLAFGAIIIVILAAVFLAVFFEKRRSSKKGLEKKIAFLNREIENLQAKYFKERSISEEYYRKRLSEFKLEISEAGKQLNRKKS
ncbi:MAG: hypothetical protein PHD95_06455 [Candidatus ainarchaeum sp.]|nr:hypothetical protein [Candidatus ainarchaeum sp.]